MTRFLRRPVDPMGDADARRALARRRRRRRARMGAAWGVVVALAVVGGMSLALGWNAGTGWLRTHTRLFQVRQVDVSATRWVAPWEVVELSGVTPGQDLFTVDEDSVAARLVRHPRIASAEVHRTWRRTVKLTVTERPPLALWLEGGTVEVAADGTVLGPPPLRVGPEWPAQSGAGDDPRGVDLPLLTGLGGVSARPGTRIDDLRAKEALAFLARLRLYGIPGETWISEVNLDPHQGLTAVTLGGVSVRIGDGRLSRRKVEALMAALDQMRREGREVRYVDARFHDQVVVKEG